MPSASVIQILLQTQNVIPHLSNGSLVVGGSCDAQVSQAAQNDGDVMAGTFSAVLPPLSGIETKVVTEGRFRVHRVPPI